LLRFPNQSIIDTHVRQAVADPKTTIELDVEQLMQVIQHRVDARPDAKSILARVEDIRRYADGVCEPTKFSNDLTSRVKSVVYQSLMRVFRGNFERQRLFNQSVVDTLQLIAEDLHKVQGMLPGDDNGPAPDRKP